MKRILVTGSRTWTNQAWIASELTRAVNDLGGSVLDASVTLVSGACPRGADAIAELIAGAWGWTIERHPADWSTHGRRAGFIRNQQMVDLGADICLVFCRNGSSGATHTGRAAEKAGIPTRWNEAL